MKYNFVVYLFLVFLAFGFIARADATWESQSISPNCIDQFNSNLSQARQSVCTLSNIERAKYGEKPLALDTRLTQAAQNFARDMAAKGYFSHVSPEGHDLKWRLKNGQIIYKRAGENIAWGYKSSHDVIHGWMNSAGHRKNILNGKFRKLGVGYSSTYWVQMFTD